MLKSIYKESALPHTLVHHPFILARTDLSTSVSSQKRRVRESIDSFIADDDEDYDEDDEEALNMLRQFTRYDPSK